MTLQDTWSRCRWPARSPRSRRRDASAAQTIQINGAGATFPDPIYSEVVLRVQQAASRRADQLPAARLRRRHPAGQRADGLLRRHATADDGRAAAGGARQDPALPDRARRASSRSTTCPASRSELKFTGPVLADIFLGKITKWNDPAIAKLNAGVKLPGTDIVVVHRSDGSGTTYIWADYLGKVSPEFEEHGRRRRVGELAGRRRRQGQRRRRGLVSRRPARSATSS